MKKKRLVLDPAGYFLIRVKDNRIEAGFCKYKDMVIGKSNEVVCIFTSEDPREILSWMEENKLYSQDSHLDYLKKELRRAALAMKNKKDYIQS